MTTVEELTEGEARRVLGKLIKGKATGVLLAELEIDVWNILRKKKKWPEERKDAVRYFVCKYVYRSKEYRVIRDSIQRTVVVNN